MLASVHRRFLLCVLLFHAGCPAGMAHPENKYDVLARTLQPFGALFYSRSPVKALQAQVELTSGPVAGLLLLNQSAIINFQLPDKLRIDTLDPNRRIIFCRAGQRVWIYPKEIADQLLAAAGPPGPPSRIPDFRLPVKDQQIVLLAALFDIQRFEAVADPRGQAAWSMDFRFAPEIMRSLKEHDWVATAVVRQHDYQLEQLSIRGVPWGGQLEIASTRFLPALPPDTWLPAPEWSGSTREIPPGYYSAAWAALTGLPAQ